MKAFVSSFFLGLLYTTMLFVICFLLVIGAKTVFNTLKKYLPENKTPPPVEKPSPKKKPSSPKNPGVIRTIEIDPNQVDRIYVKKAQ